MDHNHAAYIFPTKKNKKIKESDTVGLGFQATRQFKPNKNAI